MRAMSPSGAGIVRMWRGRYPQLRERSPSAGNVPSCGLLSHCRLGGAFGPSSPAALGPSATTAKSLQCGRGSRRASCIGHACASQLRIGGQRRTFWCWRWLDRAGLLGRGSAGGVGRRSATGRAGRELRSVGRGGPACASPSLDLLPPHRYDFHI